MTPDAKQVAELKTDEARALRNRLDTVGWALFLILLGVIWLFPEGTAPKGAFFIGIGAILLGITLAKYLMRLRISLTAILVGIFAVLIGLKDVIGIQIRLLPLLLILLGLVILAAVILKKPK